EKGEALRERPGVPLAHPEGDPRPGVRHECRGDLWRFGFELAEILMREGERQAVFPGAREEKGHGRGRDLLALVRIEKEGPALVPPDFLAAHDYLVELGDEETPQEDGVFLADRALGEPREE